MLGEFGVQYIKKGPMDLFSITNYSITNYEFECSGEYCGYNYKLTITKRKVFIVGP